MNKRARNPVSKAAPSPISPQAAAAQSVFTPSTPQQVLVTQSYSGQIPPPAMLRELDAIHPGTSALLIQMAQDEQTHRHAIEAKVTEGNVAAQQRHYGLAELQAATQREVAMYQAKTVRWSDFFGQVLGFAVCVGCSYGAFLLGMAGQTGPAIALGAIPTAAIVQSFRTMWNRKSNDKKS